MSCTPGSVANVSAEDYAKMPSTIDSEDPLLNVGKKELQQALRMAYEFVWVADWLFADSSQIFHRKTQTIPPEAFDNSLAIHLQNEISTPAQCPQQRRSLLHNDKNGIVNDSAFTVTKDIDLLLVPVVNVNGITAGYSFLNGVQEAHMGYPADNPGMIPTQDGGRGQFIAGRFAFDNKRRDFLMVVNATYPHMTGIVSMRWRDATSRERSFFAIPKADYGPGNLPSRVLSVQCNVDYEVPSQQPPQYQFKHMTSEEEEGVFEATSTSPATPPFSTASSSSEEGEKLADVDNTGDACEMIRQAARHEEVMEPLERDFTNQGDLDDDAVNIGAAGDPENWFRLDEDGGIGDWGDGLESIGTVIAPGGDGSEMLPEVLQDFTSNQHIMDDVDRIFGDASEILSSVDSAGQSLESSDVQSSTSSQKRRKADEIALSPLLSPRSQSTSVPTLALDWPTEMNGDDTSWIFNTKSGTPDGVGVPRKPGSNDTSSGAFDMSTLLGSLATIERSLKGEFYGPKVRKDILHPLTGELISRCTGVVKASVNTVDPLSLVMLRSIAAQSYYASLLAVSNDSRLIATQPTAGPFFASEQGQRQPTDEPKRKQGRTEPAKRPAPAPLAPRPVAATIALPPGLPHPEVLQIPEGETPVDEQAAKEAKLEAKRIKNRLSAARSNQKRRAQLESQKKELAALRERVAELKSKQQLVAEENENLKRQVLSRS